MPPVSGVLETSLYVEDLPRAARFYEGLFGFRPIASDDRLCALNVADRQVLLLFKRGASLGNTTPHDGSGTLHLAFSIADSELPRWEEHLAEKGIAVESKVRWPRGGTSIYFRDPEQSLVELVTPGCWTIY